jgi:hypothetical protein
MADGLESQRPPYLFRIRATAALMQIRLFVCKNAD